MLLNMSSLSENFIKIIIIKNNRTDNEFFDDIKEQSDYFNEIKDEMEFIGQHLEEMKDEIMELNEEELIYLMRKDDIIIQSEDTIWDLMKERLKEMKNIIYSQKRNKKEIEKIRNMRRILLENIKIQYLKNNNFKDYIHEIEAEDLSIMFTNSKKEENEGKYIWNQIQTIILKNFKNIKLEKKERLNGFKLIEHQIGNNFDGIIKYLESKYGNDIHDQGIINISASLCGRNKPQEVINYDSGKCWENSFGKYEPAWLAIDFKDKKIKVNGYSLKSVDINNKSLNNIGYHLKNWTIEGRNEGEEWKEIDHQDNYDLDGYNYQHYYSIPDMTEPYQYIRIKFGKSHKDKYDISLANFEVYGAIHEGES